MLAPSSVAAAAERFGRDGLLEESVTRLEVRGRATMDSVAEWLAIRAEAATLNLNVAAYDAFDEPVEDFTTNVRRIIVTKNATASTVYFFTVEGFRAFLFDGDRLADARRILIARETESFATLGFKVEPWLGMVADDEEQQPSLPPSPRRFVRDLGAGVVPASIADAVLTSDEPAGSAAFAAWRSVALSRLRVALASEAWRRDGSTFLGLAGSRFVEVPVSLNEDQNAFSVANTAARWVYEGSDVEARLVLFTAELARDWPDHASWSTGFLKVATFALAAAQRAYRQQLVERSTETLKSLTELRKNLGDEIAATIQATRDLVSSSWRDFAIAIAALIARLTIFSDGSLKSVVAGRMLVVAVSGFLLLTYSVTLISNWRFNDNISRLRETWRLQLYGYLSDAEYRTNAISPLDRVTRIYYFTAIPLGIAYIALVALLILFGYIGYNGTSAGKRRERRKPSKRQSVLGPHDSATATEAVNIVHRAR